jgi:hypothetical protein
VGRPTDVEPDFRAFGEIVDAAAVEELDERRDEAYLPAAPRAKNACPPAVLNVQDRAPVERLGR